MSLIDKEIVEQIGGSSGDECTVIFNHYIIELVKYFKETLKNYDYKNDREILDIMEKLEMYETYFPILIRTNIRMAFEIFIERVYAEHSEYILKIIESGEVARENIEYFQNLDFSTVDKNSLLHIFKFKALYIKKILCNFFKHII
jgi:hypothetical protein